MRGFYELTTAIKDYLEANNHINTVALKDLDEVDLNKRTIFPLAHINVGSASFPDNIIRFDITVSCMDIVDIVKTNVKDKTTPFFGNDNKQDILNTMLTVVNGLNLSLKKGTLSDDLYQLNGEASAEPFEDKFENLLTGWSITFQVDIPNNEISIC